MSIRETVTHEVEQLDERALEQVAIFLADLKKPCARRKPPEVVITSEMEALYSEFAKEDSELAELGMADYLPMLRREDK